MSIVIGMQNFIKIYQKIQGIGPVSLFSEFEPRQNVDQFQISFDNLIGYILMCMQNYSTIFFTVLEIGPFSLFQNVEHGKCVDRQNCQFAISWARSCQYQCLRKSLSKYSTQFSYFHFFRIEPRQRLGQSQMTFETLLGYILSISMRMPNFIKIFQTV